MARHPNFVEKLTEILMRNTKNPDHSSSYLLDQICSWISSFESTEMKHDILLNQTDPESNSVLWQKLSTEEMKSFENTDKGGGQERWNPYMLKNCSIDQLQALSESLPKEKHKTKLFTDHLKQIGLLEKQSAEEEKKTFSKLREKLDHRF